MWPVRVHWHGTCVGLAGLHRAAVFRRYLPRLNRRHASRFLRRRFRSPAPLSPHCGDCARRRGDWLAASDNLPDAETRSGTFAPGRGTNSAATDNKVIATPPPNFTQAMQSMPAFAGNAAANTGADRGNSSLSNPQRGCHIDNKKCQAQPMRNSPRWKAVKLNQSQTAAARKSEKIDDPASRRT